MRHLTLTGTFVLLLGALYGFWQHRFERTPGDPTVRLSDLQKIASPFPGVEWLESETGPLLKLRVDPAHSKIVAHLDLPNIKAVDFLHVRFQVSASHLIKGRETWEDGRCLIEWHPPTGGQIWGNDPFCSVRDQQTSGVAEMVLRPAQPPAIPALRLENLGTSGDLKLTLFEATVLRERLVWKIGRGFLLVGWLVWAVAWIRSFGKIGWLRPLLASAIWLVMGLYFVVPGPWKDVRSLAVPFQIGPESTAVQDLSASASRSATPRVNVSPANSAVLESVGKIPDQGDFTLRIKFYAANARPLLHILLLFAPTLAIACLVGRRPARALAVLLALAIEAAQLTFGYGFDWVDGFDLASDAVGIALGLWLYGRIQQREWAVRWLFQES